MSLKSSTFFFLLSGLWLLLLVFGCSTTGPATVTDSLLTGKDEKMLWSKSLEEQTVLNDSGLIYQDRVLEEYLNQIARKLQRQNTVADFSINVRVLKNPFLNAFAFPNGVIYIHTGLLARMDNEAQLAALLAHEMTHSTHRHALRALREFKKKPAFVTAFGENVLKIRGVQDLVKLFGITGLMAAVSGYTQELEAEADQVGVELMLKAGYDPHEALVLFNHLEIEIKQERIKEPFFFGTHPKVQERIDNLKSLQVVNYPHQKAGIKNSEIFLAKIRGVILDNAWLDFRLGRFHAAKQGVEKYLQIRPDDKQAYFLLGEIFRQRGQKGDTQKAIEYYNKAILIDPTFAAPHKRIGLIHYKEGHTGLAKKYFESCLLLSPNTRDKAYIQEYLKQCNQRREG